MAYERINWENTPSTATPLNATNLNKMDEGIANLDAKFGNDGILDISKGGTGNSVGYIQTGYKALSIRGNKVTIEGNNNEASADYAHAEGSNNTASRNNAHVEGRYNVASGTSSHAEGESNRASGNYSHAGGEGNVAGYSAQTVVGKYNNNKSDTLFEVGNGASDNDRKNAFEVSGDGISTDDGNTKIRFGKNDSNQYGYYRGDDPNLILFDSSIASCAGIGKKTGVNSSGVIDTDIILGRNPEKGDRFLVYFDSKVDNANSMKIYVTSGSFVTPSLFEGGLIPPEYYLNGLCLFEYKVDNILSSYYLDLIYRKEDKSYTAGRGISINNDTIANSMPQLGDNVQCKSVDSVTQGRLGSYSGDVKYLLIHFDTDAEPYSGAYSLMLSYSGSVAVMKYATLYDRVMGMEYDREIYGGSTLLCEIMDEGTGTEADPVHVDVLGVIDGYVTAGWGRQATLGDRATAEGIGTEASGNYAHAQGYQTTASGNQSTAMGYGTTASADGATAMGNGSTASGANSIAGGYNTTASGAVSTAIGTNTQATQQAQLAAGKYNKTNNDALVMVGNGTGASARSNALEVLLNGDVVAGNDLIDSSGNVLSEVAVIAEVLAEALTKTASGNPVVITDCAGGKARSLKTTIEPIQDLHGLPFPYVGGAYKNKLPTVLDIIKSGNTAGTWSGNKYTYNGVVWKIITDDAGNITAITANGTASGGNSRIYLSHIGSEYYTITLPSGDYIVNGCPVGGSSSTYYVLFYKTNTYAEYYDTGSGASLTYSTPLAALLGVNDGTTANNLVFKPMLRLSTESDASFAPYSNICPISGRTETRVDDVGKNYYNTADLRKDGDVTYTVNNGTLTITSRAVRPKVYFAPPDKFGGKNVTFSFKIDSITNGDGAVFFGLVIRNKATSIYRYASASNCTTTGNKSVSAVLAAGETIERIDFNVNDSSSPVLSSDRTYVLSNIQFEIGSTPTAYVPYVSPTYATIQLGQTVYGGTLNVKTGVLTITWVIVKFDGSIGQLWSMSSGTGYHQFMIARSSAKDTLNALTNIFQSIDISERGSKMGLVKYTDTNIRIALKDSELLIDNVDDWKAYLSNNNLQVAYELATPTTIQLTPTQLQMLKGYNRVTIDNGSIELGYIAKIA